MSKSKKKIFVIDTNVILHDATCIQNFEDNDVVIPISVLEELDQFKRGNEQIHYNARDFLRRLDELSIDAEKKYLKLQIRQINHSKFLLQQVDESINFNELIYKPTRVMGYPATQNVIGSSLGIILTGFVLAVEGFSGSNITYDINGWFNY